MSTRASLPPTAFRTASRGALLVGLLVLAPVLASCSSDEGATASDPQPASSSSTTTDSPSASSGTSCTYSEDGSPASKKVDLPPSQPTASGHVPVTITTSQGTIGATLDADNAPCTVNSFLSLASQGYFDDTRCHRLVTNGIYVLQCGDPSYSGSGGPGYSFADELSGSEQYGAGTLAMANAGPDTNGSQFFIVYKGSPLPPSYTVFGTIDGNGVGVVKKVAAAGTDNAFGPSDGHPVAEVQIESVTAAD